MAKWIKHYINNNYVKTGQKTWTRGGILRRLWQAVFSALAFFQLARLCVAKYPFQLDEDYYKEKIAPGVVNIGFLSVVGNIIQADSIENLRE